MKLIISLLTLNSSLITLFAAVPLRWTVETSRAQPATFEAYQGETLALEAALQSYGKPLEAPSNYSLYWQTNGMGSTYWSVPCVATASSPSNVLLVTWSPTNDVGARVYNCFIGQPGTIYHAAFQLRLRPSPGAIPNELPLPQKVIDLAKVEVLHPPYYTKDEAETLITIATNAIRRVDGTARQLPKYLWRYDSCDSYEADAYWYYAHEDATTDVRTPGMCTARRIGSTLERNYDWYYDRAAEFVVVTEAGPGRFASVGVANIGENLAEEFVTSGAPSRYYKCLPGRTVDGVNSEGVAIEVNVVATNGSPWETKGDRDIDSRWAVRWVLDNAPNAGWAASNLASRVYVSPSMLRRGYSVHYAIVDRDSTWLVEDGKAIMRPENWSLVVTNFRLDTSPSSIMANDPYGTGYERYWMLTNAAVSITNAWYSNAYRRMPGGDFPWPTEFAGETNGSGRIVNTDTAALQAWAKANIPVGAPEVFPRGVGTWQTVHTSIYDISNKTLRVAVQETDDWYTFQVPPPPGVRREEVKEIVEPMIEDAMPGNYGTVSNLAMTAVQPTNLVDSLRGVPVSSFSNDCYLVYNGDGYVTNVIAKRVAAEIPYEYGSRYEYDSWKQIFEVTLLDAIGDTKKGGAFHPNPDGVTAHVSILNAERYEHYDPQQGMWIYDDTWTTNNYFDGDVEFTVSDYSYGSSIEYHFTAYGPDFSSEISLYGTIGGTMSCEWYNSNSFTWDYGSISPGRIINIIDNYLTEEEIKRVVPVVTERQSTVLYHSNTTVQVHIESNVIMNVVKEKTEITNHMHDVWHEFTRDITPTNINLTHGQIFAGLRITETNRVGTTMPLYGTCPVVRVEAPFSQGYYFPSNFSAIEIGNPYQILFSQRMQLGEGIWVPNPSCIRFYDRLTTNEYDRCYSFMDIMNELDINAIRQELRSGYMSAQGGNYDCDLMLNNLILTQSLQVPTVTATTLNAGILLASGGVSAGGGISAGGVVSGAGISTTGSVSASGIVLPLDAGLAGIRFGDMSDLQEKIEYLLARFRSDPYGGGYSETTPVATIGNVYTILNDTRLVYPKKMNHNWQLDKNGCTYTITTNFYYSGEGIRSTETQVFLDFPNVTGFRSLVDFTNCDVRDEPVSFTLYVESLPLGVVIYMPLQAYLHFGWKVRFIGDVLHNVLGSGDMIRVWSCDDMTVVIEYHHSSTYTGETN